LVAVVAWRAVTDKRVNLIDAALLAEFPTAAHLGAATTADVFLHPQRFLSQ
jgi:endonuclease-3